MAERWWDREEQENILKGGQLDLRVFYQGPIFPR